MPGIFPAGAGVPAPTLAHNDGVTRSMSTTGFAVLVMWLLTGPPRRDSHPGLTPATTSDPISEESIAMPSLPATVVHLFQYVVGVDTHAATHSYAIVAASGALLDQASFPTTPAALRRARAWIGRRTGDDLDSVLIAAEGTGSYALPWATSSKRLARRMLRSACPRTMDRQAPWATPSPHASSGLAGSIPFATLDRLIEARYPAVKVITIGRRGGPGGRDRARAAHAADPPQ